MTRLTHRIAAATTAALLPLGVLAGCGGNAPEPTSKDPTSAEPKVSESPEEPTEPELPAAMEKPNAAGAKAFVKYYFELLDYAALTGDTNTLDAVAVPSCASCKGYSDSVREVYGSGGQATGGQATLSKLRVSSRGELAQGVRPFDALFSVKVTPLTITGTGAPELNGTKPAFEGKVQAQFSRGRSGWRMSEWTQL